MLWVPIVVPLLLMLVAASVPSSVAATARFRPLLVPLGGLIHLGVVTLMIVRGEGAPGQSAGQGGSSAGWDSSWGWGWLALDDLSRLVLPLFSVVFFACSLYVPVYLRLRQERSNRVFSAALLGFLAMGTLIVETHHLGLMWVALEACALATAPLLFFNENARSLEATWKYLLLGAVGIALALLGTLFLAYSALYAGIESTLVLDDVLREAPRLSRPWLHGAFILLFIGYGTKMGLAPMHTWKPDAYGESPGVVGALLAGGMTACVFLALLRFFQICAAANELAFARQIFVAGGLFSVGVGAAFMVRQGDYKRMLAYSSVEHMGLLVLGVGVGGVAVLGALLHLLNNGLAKAAMFMAAGNIHRAYGAKTVDRVSGALDRVPVSATLFLAGFFALTGTPPFGTFVSEFTILRGAMAAGHVGIAAVLMGLLLLAFVAMGSTVLKVVHGPATASTEEDGARGGGGVRFRDSLATVGPAIALLLGVCFLGLVVPTQLNAALLAAARMIEGGRP
ncbi:MAG: hydrogenase [Deltaproteobacteria bacterium]|nr:hydrogenase [Deltaproteobacteria bacterium]